MFIVLPLLKRDFFVVVVVQLCCYVLHSVSVLLAHSHFFLSLSPSLHLLSSISVSISFSLSFWIAMLWHDLHFGSFLSKCWHPELCF